VHIFTVGEFLVMAFIAAMASIFNMVEHDDNWVDGVRFVAGILSSVLWVCVLMNVLIYWEK
jgi:hypothetical protein